MGSEMCIRDSVTANGLALDENDDDDDDDDDDMHERPKLKYYKWSNERKK